MANYYNNLPGVRPNLIDGNLQFDLTSAAPLVLVIGTASKGLNETPIVSSSLSDAKATWGADGTLLRGIYEAKSQGATNVWGLRIGGTSASLEGIGVDTDTGGLMIETSGKDDTIGDRFSIFYDKSTGRLVIYDNDDEEWELDTDGELAPVDGLGDVTVSGSPVVGDGTTIGSLSAPVLISDVDGLTFDLGDAGVTYVPGTDGIGLSRMELYERLYDAYSLLDFFDADIIVPMDAYVDDLNVADLTGGEVTALGLDVLTDYPTAGADDDALGNVFVQEFEGTNYFWWDLDNDGIAEISPTVGSASASTDVNGVTLVASDFHETNFAYQLAEFCHRANRQWQFMIGTISFKLPAGFSLKAMSGWIGTSPDYTVNPSTLEQEITASADNGTGMLGNKFLAGASSYRGGEAFGGLIGTEGELPTGSWLDGVEEVDENEHVVDIGRYISIVGAVGVHTNNFAGSAYIAPVAASYAGMIATLPPQSSPTNKIVKQMRLIRNVKGHKLDELAGTRIVSLVQKSKGVCVTDAPTAARPDSDYQRLTTVRVVKKVVSDIRLVSDPFIGEPMGGAQLEALKQAIESKLQEQVGPNGGLQRYDISVTATPQQRVAGICNVDLVLVPAGELRKIDLKLTLAPE